MTTSYRGTTAGESQAGRCEESRMGGEGGRARPAVDGWTLTREVMGVTKPREMDHVMTPRADCLLAGGTRSGDADGVLKPEDVWFGDDIGTCVRGWGRWGRTKSVCVCVLWEGKPGDVAGWSVLFVFLPTALLALCAATCHWSSCSLRSRARSTLCRQR